jgi:Divergent InlB B-repeat domain
MKRAHLGIRVSVLIVSIAMGEACGGGGGGPHQEAGGAGGQGGGGVGVGGSSGGVSGGAGQGGAIGGGGSNGGIGGAAGQGGAAGVGGSSGVGGAGGSGGAVGGSGGAVGGSGGAVGGSSGTGGSSGGTGGTITPPVNYRLDVAKAGNGGGSITSSPAGIDCGATCAASYAQGTMVTLTAMPDGQSVFTGWTGACTGSGTCMVTMDQARAVVATFTRQSHALTVTKVGNAAAVGSVTSMPAGIDCGSDCSETYAADTVVVLTATAPAGSKFTGWSGGGCPAAITCTLTITAAVTVTASFTYDQYLLTVAKNGTGSGTVSGTGISCGTDCSETFTIGSIVMLTATAAPGSTFTGWTGGGCTGKGACNANILAPTTVTATFMVEDCRNGIDDDGDGLADCADPDCTGQSFRCVAVPTGWSGPVARWHGAGTTPGCTGDFSTSAYTGSGSFSPGPASCTACTCSGQSCGIQGSVFDSPTEGGCEVGIPLPMPNTVPLDTCVRLPSSSIDGKQIARIAADQNRDTCGTPSGGAVTRNASSFLETARLCASPRVLAGCGAGSVCAPPSAAPFEQKLCIYRQGSFACPAGFSAPATYYTGYTDTRVCSACSCTGGCGTLSGTWYSGTTCDGAPRETSTIGLPAACNDFVVSVGSARFSSSNTCSASGGQVSGSVTAANPVTVCCEP